MAIALDGKSVSLEQLLIYRVVRQEALTRLLVEKGIFTQEEFSEMLKTVDLEMKKKRGSKILKLVYNGEGR